MREQDRAAVIGALECVDYVTLFDGKTPEPLLRRLKPDVLVKGGDYSDGQVVGRKVVESYGGRVELAPLVKGVSSSALIERMRGKR
jgi:D-beta-D-heptose 7-phosphate kinase/D-beta-D-heptose 1-phosphate adenosyltransferase